MHSRTVEVSFRHRGCQMECYRSSCFGSDASNRADISDCWYGDCRGDAWTSNATLAWYKCYGFTFSSGNDTWVDCSMYLCWPSRHSLAKHLLVKQQHHSCQPSDLWRDYTWATCRSISGKLVCTSRVMFDDPIMSPLLGCVKPAAVRMIIDHTYYILPSGMLRG